MMPDEPSDEPDLSSVYAPTFEVAEADPVSFVQRLDADGEQYKVRKPKLPKPPPIECGKIAPNGDPCFLSVHATPAPVSYLTPRYDASTEEIEKYRQATLGCIGRKRKEG
jgi:hypothetical protein